MPSLSDHQSSEFTKLMLLGNSGVGKTGALVSLLGAGYKLRILDMDNGLDSLVAFAKREHPDKLGNVSYVTCQDDKYKVAGTQVILEGTPKDFVNAIKLLDKWEDGSKPSEWGPDTIFVLDSLTRLGDAAFRWARGLNGGAKDPRQWYGAAQEGIEHVVSMITSSTFKTNAIIITHLKQTELPDGTMKFFPSAIGQALGPTIPTYFNTLVLAETTGFGESTKRRIKTLPTGMVDLKNPVPFALNKELPLESGMAELFSVLRSGTRQPQSPTTQKETTHA